MADTNPPNEIYDGESPANRDSNSPNSYALYQQIGNGYVEQHQEGEGDGETEHPALRGAAAQHDRADLIGDGRKRIAWLQDGSLSRFVYVLRALRIHEVPSESTTRCP